MNIKQSDNFRRKTLFAYTIAYLLFLATYPLLNILVEATSSGLANYLFVHHAIFFGIIVLSIIIFNYLTYSIDFDSKTKRLKIEKVSLLNNWKTYIIPYNKLTFNVFKTIGYNKVVLYNDNKIITSINQKDFGNEKFEMIKLELNKLKVDE